MRATASFMVLLFCLQAFMGFVSATTPETMTVDGDVSEWSTDSELGTDSNGVSLHVTWDANNFYVAWIGTDWASTSEGADLFVYFNTSEGGSVLSKDWNFALPLGLVISIFNILEPTKSCKTMLAVTIGPIPRDINEPKLAPRIVESDSN